MKIMTPNGYAGEMGYASAAAHRGLHHPEHGRGGGVGIEDAEGSGGAGAEAGRALLQGMTDRRNVMAQKAKRKVTRSSKGKKLYVVRDESGQFKDIQQYSRAHGQDIKRGSGAEGKAAAKKAAKRPAKNDRQGRDQVDRAKDCRRGKKSGRDNSAGRREARHPREKGRGLDDGQGRSRRSRRGQRGGARGEAHRASRHQGALTSWTRPDRRSRTRPFDDDQDQRGRRAGSTTATCSGCCSCCPRRCCCCCS